MWVKNNTYQNKPQKNGSILSLKGGFSTFEVEYILELQIIDLKVSYWGKENLKRTFSLPSVTKIFYKDEHSRIILKIVGVFYFLILKFDEGKCPPAWAFSNVGVHPNGELRIWSQNLERIQFSRWLLTIHPYIESLHKHINDSW